MALAILVYTIKLQIHIHEKYYHMLFITDLIQLLSR
jgi:hypothetical protein